MDSNIKYVPVSMASVLVYEILMWTKQLHDRKVLYHQAEDYAIMIGKPLLVVGNPKGRHPCGDVNVDLDGSVCPMFEQASIEDLNMFSDGKFGAVFVGHVLEHVDNIEKAYSELVRVIDDVVYVAYPDWYSLIAHLHPDHKWLILSAPPRGKLRYIQIRYKV